jgi:hypothetical protein
MVKNILKVTTLIILLSSSGIIYGQRLKGVGLNGGYIIPIKNIQNGFSVEARFDFGEVLKYVFFFPTVSYWRIQDKSDLQNLTRNHVNFGVNFLGYINSKPRGFYGGGGIHFHILSADELDYSYRVENPDIKSKTDTKLGFSLIMGYLLPFKRISLYLEPGYTFIHGADDTFQARLGLYYKL